MGQALNAARRGAPPRPGMAEDLATLDVLALGALPDPRVVGDVLGVVAWVVPGDEAAPAPDDVVVEDRDHALGRAVAGAYQPGLEAPALLGGGDEDVVLAHRGLGLDGEPRRRRPIDRDRTNIRGGTKMAAGQG